MNLEQEIGGKFEINIGKKWKLVESIETSSKSEIDIGEKQRIRETEEEK